MSARQLTEKEIIALHYHVLTGYDNFKTLYFMAFPEKDENRLTNKSINTYVSNWKKSPVVQDKIKELEYIERRKKDEIDANHDRTGQEEKTTAETLPTKQDESRTGADLVNFLDRDEFLAFLNEKANQVVDDKLRNDILKMLSDNLRYKDAETAENDDIQRFYTPLTCENCPLYIEKARK